MIEYLEVGKIVNTHGVRGEIKVMPLTDNPERFKDLNWVYIEVNSQLKKFNIKGVKFFKSMILLKLEGIDDVDSASSLRNSYLKVDREHAVKLPDNSYFICDIIDCEVYEDNGNMLGLLKDVINTGSNDVYVVKKDGTKDILIPALKSVVKSISLDERKITVTLPEGLIDNEV